MHENQLGPLLLLNFLLLETWMMECWRAMVLTSSSLAQAVANSDACSKCAIVFTAQNKSLSQSPPTVPCMNVHKPTQLCVQNMHDWHICMKWLMRENMHGIFLNGMNGTQNSYTHKGALWGEVGLNRRGNFNRNRHLQLYEKNTPTFWKKILQKPLRWFSGVIIPHVTPHTPSIHLMSAALFVNLRNNAW